MLQAATVIASIAALLVAQAVGAVDELDLTSAEGWQLDNSLGFGNVSLGGGGTVTLPVAVHQVLQGAGVIGDPFYRFNELEHRWVALDNWTFSLHFRTPPALLRHTAVLLRCDGLDTVAAIELNGAPVGFTANAHRPHAFDVTGLLAPGGDGSAANRLAITLFSAPAFAAAQAAAYPYEVPATEQLGSLPGYNFIRKAASDFGWDWGPAFAPPGINSGCALRGQSAALLEGLAVRQAHLLNGSVRVAVDALLLPLPTPAAGAGLQAEGEAEAFWGDDSPTAGAAGTAAAQEQGTLLLEVSSPDGRQVWRTQARVSVPLAAAASAGACRADGDGAAAEACPWALPEACSAAGTASPLASPVPQPLKRSGLSVLIEWPQLWWPHDFGEQPLYGLRLTYTPGNTDSTDNASVAVTDQSEPEPSVAAPGIEAAAQPPAGATSAGSTLSSTVRRLGLRRVELAREALPGGETFYFRVNGQPLYARGANIVPAHVFEPAATPARLSRLVADAKAAHMNMLRVWGGGRYFKDEFYEACDEAGVLVWQEAMFACGMYPRDDAFLREAWLEVRHHAVRLSSHPSVAVWGGNNENEAAFGWFAQPQLNPRLYASDYTKLFVDVVRQAVLGVDPATPFVDSSPSNGLLSSEPYAKRWGDVADPRFGDNHVYDYASDAWDPATYPPAKFVSEFGFMSLPSFAAYKRVTEPEDWRLDAPLTAFRMRHAGGLEELLAQMGRHFLRPPQPAGEPQQQGAPARQAQQAGQQTADLQSQAQPGGQEGGEAASWQAMSAREQLQRLAAAQSQLNAVFDAAAAAGGDPVAAVHAAAAAAAAAERGAERGASSGASVPPLPPPASEGQLQEQEQRSQREFAAFTYLSQLQQALAYQAAIHRWRRAKVDPGALTMGVLYWQLNDVWQGPSWSSINADGSWRLAHHFARSFFSPVLVSGLLVEGGAVEVHLTNDLPVHVMGSLAVDAIPYGATRPEHVVPLFRADNASVAAYDSGLAWSGTIAGDVLPAVGQAMNAILSQEGQVTGGGGPRAADAADVFLRLRFCPTVVRRQQAEQGAAVPPPDPFGSLSAAEQLRLAFGGGSGTMASDGGSAAPPCESPVELPAGATVAQCAAARRLLQCSESLVLLVEPKDARLAPVAVSVRLVAPAGGQAAEGLALPLHDAPGPDVEAFEGSGASSGGGGSGSDSLAVTLRSDGVALFVAVENEGRAGSFNGSGTLLLLPWEPQTLVFHPAEALGDEDAAAGPPHQGQPPADELASASSGELLQPAAEAAEGSGAAAAGQLLHDIQVQWLQKEMAALQPPEQAQQATVQAESRAQHASRRFPLALLAATVALLLG